MTPRTLIATFTAVTLGAFFGLRYLGSHYVHAYLIYPLAGVGLVTVFGCCFLLTEPPAADACARCGRDRIAGESKFERSGLQAWPICPECRAKDRYEVEEVGRV